MKRISIIGGGFSGSMLTTQLIKKTKSPLEIFIFDKKENFAKGVAFNPYSDHHLLNVRTKGMSAFPDQPNHFLDWVCTELNYDETLRNLVSESFMPRKLYGNYLQQIWQEVLEDAKTKGILVNQIHEYVTDLVPSDAEISIKTQSGKNYTTNFVVLATGNELPRNPRIPNMAFYQNATYFQNPWSVDSVTQTKSDLPVLIIGNGLTMVDTVFGLLENGYKGKIISISPNGFNILSHKSSHYTYTALTNEIESKTTLYEIFKNVHQHIKKVRQLGVTAEPVIDSLRPHTQKIWQSLSIGEKKIFMARLRHLWGVARHRLPIESYDKIQKLRLDGNLQIISGKLHDIHQNQKFIEVAYFDKKLNQENRINVSRVINCTGPESDIQFMNDNVLKNCLEKNILFQDECRLGIKTNVETFQILKPDNSFHANLFTIGSWLKGELWESTAVPELRVQADLLANRLIHFCEKT